MNENLKYYLVIALVFSVLIFLGRSITASPFFVLAIILSAVAALVTFQKPANGLLILVFSMMLSPEIIVAQVPGRAVTIRIDDMLIMIVFLSWVAYMVMREKSIKIEKTPLDIALILLTFIFIISTMRGILIGNITFVKGFFYTLKYIEYFVMFLLVANIAKNHENVNVYLWAGIITLIIVTLYGYSMMNTAYRVYAPFDAEGGEPASLGGYFIVMFSILFSYLVSSDNFKTKMFSLALILFILPPFIKTLSRASYVAFVPMILTIFALTKKGKSTLLMFVVIGAVLFPLIGSSLYNDMQKRIGQTFTGHSFGRHAVNVGGTTISDASALARIDSWRSVVNTKFSKNFITVLIGNGVTGIGFVETQFFLQLGEIGLIGILLFYLIIFKIFIWSYRIYKNSSHVQEKSLSLGLAGAVVGLLAQSTTTNTFIIVRIMEPFWFLTGIVMGLYYTNYQNNMLGKAAS